MPGLHVEITLKDLKQYKTQHPYGDISLREWTCEHYNIPEHQPIQSMGLSQLNLKGEDLTFVDFQGLSITDCQIDANTRFAGASFQDTAVTNTPVVEAADISYSLHNPDIDDGDAFNNSDSMQRISTQTDFEKRVHDLSKEIVKNDEDLESEITKSKDPFQANLKTELLRTRTSRDVDYHKNTAKELESKIFGFLNYHPKMDQLTLEEIQEIRDSILKRTQDIALFPEDVDGIKRFTEHLCSTVTSKTTVAEIIEAANPQIDQWRKETEAKHSKLRIQLNVIAHSPVIKRDIHTKSKPQKSMWQQMKDTTYSTVSHAKARIIGGTAGAALGIAQADSFKSAAVKGGIGAVLGAAAVNAIPERLSPIAPSDWPAIDPKNEALKSRDVQLKLRGLFWCAMLSGGAIEGITGATLGIETISTIASSFGLVKTLVSAQEFNINDDPKNMSSIVSRGVKKLDGVLSQYQESLDSQLGDRLLEIGTIMEQIEPRLGIIMLNRKIMQVTQFGSPGFLGDILSTSQSIQNFFSFWSIKNNFYAVTDSLKTEQEKPFMERQRPGSPVLTKEIEEKMWLKKVSLRSMTTVLGLSLLVVLGIAAAPLFGAAAAAIGMKAAIIGTCATIAVATTGYISYSVLKGTSIKNITKIFTPAKPASPAKPGAKELSKARVVDAHSTSHAHHTTGHVARLEEKRGSKGHDQQPKSQVERLKRSRSQSQDSKLRS
ncbi:MAG: hypothetical protein KBC27_01280 [Rickettsiales bacterium]|nr:hypothetical protein [Rickettsiales bacterium]